MFRRHLWALLLNSIFYFKSFWQNTFIWLIARSREKTEIELFVDHPFFQPCVLACSPMRCIMSGEWVSPTTWRTMLIYAFFRSDTDKTRKKKKGINSRLVYFKFYAHYQLLCLEEKRVILKLIRLLAFGEENEYLYDCFARKWKLEKSWKMRGFI